MNFRHIFCLLFVFTPALQASEFYYQNQEAEFEYTVSLELQSAETRFRGGADIDAYESILSLQVERSIFKTWAVGLMAGFGYGETSRLNSDEKSVGFEDLQAFVKGFYPTSAGSIRYGLTIFTSLGDGEVDSENESNRFSGGTTGSFFLGYEHTDGPYSLGFRLRQEFGFDDRIEVSDSGGEVQVQGTHDFEVSFFLEKQNESDSYWGGSISHTMTSDRETNGVLSENISPVLSLAVYRLMAIGKSRLIPRLSLGFGMAEEQNGVEIDDHTVLNAQIAYRF